MAADRRGSELRVNTFVAGDQENPAIAVSPLGTFVVAWESEEQDGEGEGIYARLYRSGGSASGPEFRVNTTTEDDQINPDVAMDANGGFVVVWESETNEGQSIYAQRYNASGQQFNSEFRVNPTVDSENSDPSIAQNRNGAFVVAWAASGVDDDVALNADPNSTGVYVQRYDNQGAPLDSTIRVNTTTLNAQDNPDVAIQSNGSFIVVWESDGQDGGGSGIFAQRYNSIGTAIGIEFQINNVITSNQINPVIAVDTVGNFVVAWESNGQDGSGSGIYARLYDTDGNPRATQFRVNSTTQGDQSEPTIGMDAEGNFTIAWTSQRNDNDERSGIYAQQYSLNGDRIDSEFRVNSTTEDDQTAPSIATQSNGDFVVSWQSDTPSGNDNQGLGDGDELGVFGQRYRGDEDLPTDLIKGDSRANRLQGSDASDRILGYGNDDILFGGSSNDTLNGGSGDDDLRGQQGDDVLKGEVGRDILKGGVGQDTLFGGAGRDTFIGGGGADIFVIGERFGLEEIQDFTDGIDKIRLDGTVTSIRLEQPQATTVIYVNNNAIALLSGISQTLITRDDFTNLPSGLL